jgi:hypothetical protein
MTEEKSTKSPESHETPGDEEIVQNRRGFLISLGKWSAAVVTGAVLGAGALAPTRDAEAGAWINNRGGWGGGGWVNRHGGGGGWINRYGGGGAGWVNGGGGGWINRRGGYGGGSWINRY